MKFLAIYWVGIYIAIEGMRWIDKNTRYLAMFLVLCAIGIVGYGIVKVLRRW